MKLIKLSSGYALLSDSMKLVGIGPHIMDIIDSATEELETTTGPRLKMLQTALLEDIVLVKYNVGA